MIFYLDGISSADCSTLAQRLNRDLPDYHYVHFDLPDQEDVEAFFHDRLEEYFLNGHENLIIDRLHFSNYAYGTRFGPNVLTDFEWWRLDNWLSQMPNVCIMLSDDPMAIVRRMNETSLENPAESILKLSDIGPIQNRFNQALARSQFNPKGSYTLDQFLDLPTDLIKPLYLDFLDYIRRN